MFDIAITVCYLVVAQPELPETCVERTSPMYFASEASCETYAVRIKAQFQRLSRTYGHELTKLEHDCFAVGEET